MEKRAYSSCSRNTASQRRDRATRNREASVASGESQMSRSTTPQNKSGDNFCKRYAFYYNSVEISKRRQLKVAVWSLLREVVRRRPEESLLTRTHMPQD